MASIFTGLVASAKTSSAIASVSGVALASIEALDAAGHAALSNIESTATGAITDSVNSALSAFGTAAGTIFSKVGSTLETALGAIAKVVTDVISHVNKVIDAINKFLAPITKALQEIAQIYQTISTLVNVIEADLHNGILGILEIPLALSNGLTSLESALQRLSATATAAATDTVKNVLVPGMSSAIGDPLKLINDTFSAPAETDYDLTAGIQPQTLEQCGVGPGFNSKVARIQAELVKPSSIVDYLGKILSDVGWIALYLEAAVIADVECIKQTARLANPSELLGVGDVLEAVYRGILSDQQAEDEVRRRGFSPDRYKTLKENLVWLPDIRMSFTLFWRSVISEDELFAILAKLHLSKADATALLTAIPEPLNPREEIAVFGREAALGVNFLQASLGSVPPASARAKYLPLGLDESRATYDWLAHWRIPDPDWWLTRYVRGLGSLDDAENAAVALNYPEEILKDLLPTFQETIQQWMIPDILAAGMLDEQQALAYAKFIGMEDKSAAIMVQWGLSKAKAPVSALAANLQSVSAAQAKLMYEDHVVDEATYIQILEQHGYSPDAAQLTVALAKQEVDIKALTTLKADLLAEVDHGVISEAEMVSKLYAAGLSQLAVEAQVLKIKAAKVAKTKQPTLAEFTDWLKVGIIDGDTYVNDLVALGYSAENALNYYTYEVALHGNPPKPLSTSAGSIPNRGQAPAVLG